MALLLVLILQFASSWAGKAGHSSLQYLSKVCVCCACVCMGVRRVNEYRTLTIVYALGVQKQWHVSNFANKVKVWKAEAKAEKIEKDRLFRSKVWLPPMTGHCPL